jgi:protein PhnA
MSKPTCPACTLDDVISHPDKWECATCGHEWPKEAAPEAAETGRVVKDANGNVLVDGDAVTLIKDLKLGGSQVLKAGAKAKSIRLQDGDHEISCKVDGVAVALKACFVKKA